MQTFQQLCGNFSKRSMPTYVYVLMRKYTYEYTLRSLFVKFALKFAYFRTFKTLLMRNLVYFSIVSVPQIRGRVKP